MTPSAPTAPRFRLSGSSTRPRFADFILGTFLCVQVLDGVLTYLGVSSFGWTEGNPLIAWYMKRFGVGVSLTVAKLVAIGCAVVLHLMGFHRMLAVLTLLYLSVAILPWTVILFVLH